MSSRSVLQKSTHQTLEIVEKFASVAEDHGKLRRIRTDTIVRAVIVFVCSFMCFVFHRLSNITRVNTQAGLANSDTRTED